MQRPHDCDKTSGTPPFQVQIRPGAWSETTKGTSECWMTGNTAGAVGASPTPLNPYCTNILLQAPLNGGEMGLGGSALSGGTVALFQRIPARLACGSEVPVAPPQMVFISVRPWGGVERQGPPSFLECWVWG